jgi:hypothetical protein
VVIAKCLEGSRDDQRRVADVPWEVLSRLHQGFRDTATVMEWAVQWLDKKILFAGGILLAICASASYLLLSDKKSLVQIENSIADRLGFLEEPCC